MWPAEARASAGCFFEEEDISDQEAGKGLRRGHREHRVHREEEPKTQAHTPCLGHPVRDTVISFQL
jgi:hypothetical protein